MLEDTWDEEAIQGQGGIPPVECLQLISLGWSSTTVRIEYFRCKIGSMGRGRGRAEREEEGVLERE